METMEIIKEMAICEFVYFSVDEMLEKFKELVFQEIEEA